MNFGFPLAFLWLSFGLPLACLWLAFGLLLSSLPFPLCFSFSFFMWFVVAGGVCEALVRLGLAPEPSERTARGYNSLLV